MYFLRCKWKRQLLILGCALRQTSLSPLLTAEVQLGLRELQLTSRTVRGP